MATLTRKQSLIVMILIPFVCNLCAYYFDLTWLFCFSPLLILILAGLLPALRYTENVAIFISVAISTLPLNIKIALYYVSAVTTTSMVSDVSMFFIAIVALLSIEEIIYSLFSSIIWKDQDQILIK